MKREVTALRCENSFVERETGLEPATTCLEGREEKRREPLASFLESIILYRHLGVNLRRFCFDSVKRCDVLCDRTLVSRQTIPYL